MVLWLRLPAPNTGGTGSSMVGELRSHVPRGTAKQQQQKAYLKKKKRNRAFLGGSVQKNLSASAGDTGFIPHVAEQLSPCAITTEPVL